MAESTPTNQLDPNSELAKAVLILHVFTADDYGIGFAGVPAHI